MEEEKKQQQVDIEINIKSIMLESFEATDAGRTMPASLGGDGYEFNLGFKLDVEEENTLSTTAVIILRKIDDKVVLATMSLSMKFVINDLDRFVVTDELGNKKVDNYLAQLFAGVSISTSRGVFSVHSAQFNFRDAYLPIVDPKQFLRDDSEL